MSSDRDTNTKLAAEEDEVAATQPVRTAGSEKHEGGRGADRVSAPRVLLATRGSGQHPWADGSLTRIVELVKTESFCRERARWGFVR